MQSLSVDDAYDIIGHFGYSQFIYFFIVGLLQIFGALHMLLSIFIGLEIPFICHPSENNADPLFNSCPGNVRDNCESFDYNTSTFASVVTEWDLVCNEKYKLAMIQSVWMGGIMVGSIFLLGLADHFGRLPTMMISFVSTIGLECFSALVHNYLLLLVLRFLGGVTWSLSTSAFVLMQELMGASYRSTTCLLISIFFAIGIGVLSALAAALKEWRTLTLVSSLAGLGFLLVPCFLPESPRWLLGKGETLKAKQILEHMACKNGTYERLPSHWKLGLSSNIRESAAKSQGSIFSFFYHSYLLKLTLIMIYSWFVNTVLYYGLTMAATSLPGNIFVSTTLNGLVEIPSLILGIFIVDRLGRRKTISGAMICSGLSCIVIPLLPPSSPAISICALIGKLSISASFGFILIHSSEIFPTSVRNAGIGLVCGSSRIGGILAPFILSLKDLMANLDFIIMGILGLTSGLLNLMLPETFGKPMPETIGDLIDGRTSPRPLQRYFQRVSADEISEDQAALLDEPE